MKTQATLALTAILLMGAKAPALTPPPGWAALDEPGFCAIQRGAFVLGTENGRDYILGIEGIRQAHPDARVLTIGGDSYSVVFEPVDGGIAGELDASTLAALRTNGRAAAGWIPGGGFDLDAAAAVAALEPCGKVLAVRASRKQRWSDFASRLGAATAIMGSTSRDESSFHPPPISAGMTCLKRREWTSGFNKNCVYDCLGSEAVQTIGAAQLCPMTITR